PAFFVSKLCGAGSPTRLSFSKSCGAGSPTRLSLFRDCVVPGLRPGILCFEIVWCRVSDPAFFVSRLCGAGSPTRHSLFSRLCGAGSPTRHSLVCQETKLFLLFARSTGIHFFTQISLKIPPKFASHLPRRCTGVWRRRNAKTGNFDDIYLAAF